MTHGSGGAVKLVVGMANEQHVQDLGQTRVGAVLQGQTRVNALCGAALACEA